MHTAFLFRNVPLCTNICAPFRLFYHDVVGVGARNREQSPKVPQICIIRFEAVCYQAFQVSWCQWFVVQNSPRGEFALQCLMAVEFPHSRFTLTLYMILLPAHHQPVRILGRFLSPEPIQKFPALRVSCLGTAAFPSTHTFGWSNCCLQVKSSPMSPGHDAEHSRVPSQIQVFGELYNHPKLSLT